MNALVGRVVRFKSRGDTFEGRVLAVSDDLFAVLVEPLSGEGEIRRESTHQMELVPSGWGSSPPPPPPPPPAGLGLVHP